MDGRPDNAGTEESPWDITSALGGRQAIAPGALVYLQGGTYRHPDRRWESPGLAIALEGEPGRPIHIRPAPEQRVTLDGKAEVSGLHLAGNIAFAPIKEGDRQRLLIGGGRPSRRITAADNILYEVPLQIGYNAPYNEDATVTGNWIVHAGLLISNFQEVTQRDNTVIPPDGPRPQRPADILLRPSRYTPGRANLAIFNRARRQQVEVDLASLLPFGQTFRIVNALDFFGTPVVTGTFDGKPVSVPIPVEARTGRGEFCAFVVLPSAPGAAATP